MKKDRPTPEQCKLQLRTYFLQLVPDTDLNELNELVEEFELEEFPQKHLILEANDNSDTFRFVCKGLARIYYIKEQKEINHWFIKENMILVPAYAILTGQQNMMNFKTIETTYALKIKYSVMESYYYKYNSLNHLGRKLVEMYYGAFMIKTFNLMFLSADERYKLFMKENVDLASRIPLRFIASFLGIQQETLSRLRAKH